MRKPSYIDHWIFRTAASFCDLLYLLQSVICLLQALQRGALLHVIALLACPSLILGFAAYKAPQRRFEWPSLHATARADHRSISELGREQIAQSAITRSLVLDAGHLR